MCIAHVGTRWKHHTRYSTSEGGSGGRDKRSDSERRKRNRKRRALGLSGGAADGVKNESPRGRDCGSGMRANEQHEMATTQQSSSESYDMKAMRAALRRERVFNTRDHETGVKVRMFRRRRNASRFESVTGDRRRRAVASRALSDVQSHLLRSASHVRSPKSLACSALPARPSRGFLSASCDDEYSIFFFGFESSGALQRHSPCRNPDNYVNYIRYQFIKQISEHELVIKKLVQNKCLTLKQFETKKKQVKSSQEQKTIV